MPPPIACVTGATGFLASELVAQLLSQGYRVQATVRSLSNAAKVACLRDLPGAADKLSLYEADLLDVGSFDACVNGAQYVFHTASPFVTHDISDPYSQLHIPAREGTKHVFSSIARAIEAGSPRPRVVLTSSVAAIMGKPTDKAACFDEDDWNSTSEPEGNPLGDGLDMYRYSKLISEREAWALAQRQGLEMAAILPSFIVGPPRTPRADSESLRNMKQALQGEVPHRADTPMVDVRDCAAAHIAAAEVRDAAGRRFITSSDRAVTRAHVLRLLRQHYPQIDIVDGGSPADPAELRHVLCSKNLPLLGVSLRALDSSLLDMAQTMLDLGSVQPKLRRNDEL